MCFLGLIAATVWISGCSPGAPPAAGMTPTSPPTAPHAISSTSIPLVLTPSPSPQPSPTLPTCEHQPGQITETEIVDDRLPRPLPIRVYRPACLETELSERFPVIYLLHGLTYTDSQWDDLGVDELMDALTGAGKISPALIVMPWERTGIDLEQAIPQVLIPYVDSHYRTLAGQRGRAIGGISRGGGWALRIGLQHPELFASIGLHSPAVLAPDLFRIPDWAEAIPRSQMPRIWIDMGDRDTLRFELARLRSVLDDSNIPYEWHTFLGEHTPTYWGAHSEAYLRWYDLGW